MGSPSRRRISSRWTTIDGGSGHPAASNACPRVTEMAW
jgi:hypothetical protein